MSEPVPVLSGTLAPSNQVNLTWDDPGTSSTVIFTSNGTYSVSLAMIQVAVTLIAGGAGGESGGCTPGLLSTGGRAGGAGGISEQVYTPNELTSTVSVTVGTGGTGGAGTSASANQFSTQNFGSGGNSTLFGGYLTAYGGTPLDGSGHTAQGGAGSTQQGGGYQGPPTFAGAAAFYDEYPGNAAVSGGTATIAPGGGGGGGYATNQAGGNQPGADGGAGQTSLVPSAGGAPSTNGANADMVSGYAGGGGGGGSAVAGLGSAGGNGGLYGAGGGGGSCGFSQTTSYVNGSGGNGANGVAVMVETYPPPSGYNVYRNSVLIATTTSLAYADANLAEGTYSYVVTAIYANVESPQSNEVTFTTTVPAGQRLGTTYATGQLIAQYQTAEDPNNPLLEE